MYIDALEKGDRPQKKLIAQQVKQVYPIAVNTTTDFIPNVYQLTQSTAYNAEYKLLTIRTEKAHSFAVGDMVRIIDEDASREVEVLTVVDDHAFTIASEKALKKVFVYGKQVDDFLALDYDALSMLNVSATQELSKRIDTQQSSIKRLEAENALLKSALLGIEAGNARLKMRMAPILSTLQHREAI